MGVGLWIRKCHMLVQSPSYMSIEMFWVGTIDHEICTWSMYGLCMDYVSSYMHYIDECGEHLWMRICMEFCSTVLLLRCRTGKKVEWICTLIIRGRYDLIGRAVRITNKVSAGKKLESVKSHDGSSWSRRL